MTGYKRKSGRKRKSREYYPLSSTSRYLIHLANIVWQESLTKDFDFTLLGAKQTTIASLFSDLGKRDMRQEYWLKRLPPSPTVHFSMEALCEHWPRPLLEAKFFLSLKAGNARSLGKLVKSKTVALLRVLHPNLSPNEYMRLWHRERFSLIPFHLKVDSKNDLTLAPDYNGGKPVQTLWAWIAMLLVEIEERQDRLKVCEFIDPNRGQCLNLFWDESKNKVKKYCDEVNCKKARLRQKVSAWRKKSRKAKSL